MTTDDDRIAYLAGDRGTGLDPAEQAGLEDLVDLLSDPSVWAEPDRSLEDRVVAAVTAQAKSADGGRSRAASSQSGPVGRTTRASRTERGPRTRRHFSVILTAVAAGVVVAIAVTVSAMR